jgi:ring-1,2-phenylacetyl-CoA epoxidase subunit PaaD
VVTDATLRDRAWAAASAVVDPELPALTIADLGVLRDVSVTDGAVEVVITPTYSGCPAMQVIALDIVTALERAGIAGARVRTVLSPAWTTSPATERLAEFGSTACKALWRCTACREPFDHFKCH